MRILSSTFAIPTASNRHFYQPEKPAERTAMQKFLYLFFILTPMLASPQPAHIPQHQSVPANWQFRKAGAPEWYPVAIPASIHTALLKNGLIEDPFYRDNEEKLQWIEKEDWEFRCNFDVDPGVLDHKHVEMALKGLDTYAHVYLNDSLVLEADNMFRTWRADVRRWLKPKGNELHIYFESPVEKVDSAWKNLGYELPGGIRTMTRKAQFHFGWDWGPRFAGCGILKTPELVAWDDLIIEDVYTATQSLSDTRAVMVTRFRYRSDFAGDVMVSNRYGKIKTVENRRFESGVHEDSITFDVGNPQLWWCQGLGEQNLYDFSLEIRRGGRSLDRAETRVGIRTVELVREKDAKGETFFFRLNGVPVFAKGANYIPQDIFQDRVRPEQYGKLIDDVVAANMNMLRVWGGGIYEDDLFYQLCDAKGILVWQDFMFACALYPGNGAFLKNVSAEAYEQILRLRQHPCIALWCGNNENNEAWHHWGWQMSFSEAQRAQLWRDYTLLFKDLLPTYVKNYGNGVPYWESSPSYGRANPKSLTEGDSHYWGVWHDKEPFSEYEKKVPRFMSEYGFQSFPNWRTIESFTLPDDRELQSKVMLVHQKHPKGNALIREYLKRDYREPRKFEDFVYISQLLQAEGMRTGIEAHRRAKPYCMGSLYWQLNDVWPVASWAGRDYAGRWKALHYFAQEAFSPVAALPTVQNGNLEIHSVSDLKDSSQAVLNIRAVDFNGGLLFQKTVENVQLHPEKSLKIWDILLNNKDLKKIKWEESALEISLADPISGKSLYRRIFFLKSARELKLPRTTVKILATEPVKDGYMLTLVAEQLAKNIYLATTEDGHFDQNFFDMLPQEKKLVFFRTSSKIENPASSFQIKSLVDTY